MVAETAVPEDYLGLLLFAFSVAALFSSYRWYQFIPRMFYREKFLKEKELLDLKKESASLNTPSTFHLYAKAQRKMNSIEKEIKAIEKKYWDKGGWTYMMAPYYIFYMIRYGYVIPAYILWSKKYPQFVMIPQYSVLHPANWDTSNYFATRGNLGIYDAFRSCSLLIWILFCHVAIRYTVRCFAPNFRL